VTLGEVLDATADYLASRGVEHPRLDAELLLARALGLSRLDLYTQHDRPLTPAERESAREPVRRRGAREPLAYVLGDWGFRRLTLRTDRRALVPRPETEVVVDRCLALLENVARPRVLDVGTGTGAIALSLAQELNGATIVATDASAEALALARENSELLGFDVELREGDLLAGATGPFELVVSNPPYVEAGELDALEPEVRDWEPRTATVGEEHTAAIAAGAAGVLGPGGWLVLEIAAGRGEQVSELLRGLGYEEVRAGADLAGRDRVVEGRWTR
jgi:release factor glutamine methyltransferase